MYGLIRFHVLQTTCVLFYFILFRMDKTSNSATVFNILRWTGRLYPRVGMRAQIVTADESPVYFSLSAFQPTDKVSRAMVRIVLLYSADHEWVSGICFRVGGGEFKKVNGETLGISYSTIVDLFLFYFWKVLSVFITTLNYVFSLIYSYIIASVKWSSGWMRPPNVKHTMCSFGQKRSTFPNGRKKASADARKCILLHWFPCTVHIPTVSELNVCPPCVIQPAPP